MASGQSRSKKSDSAPTLNSPNLQGEEERTLAFRRNASTSSPVDGELERSVSVGDVNLALQDDPRG